jgi:hypothetical protein
MESPVEPGYSYTVMTSDNFHHMDPEGNEPYKLADFDSCEAALSACRRVVDEFLLSTYKVGMTAQELRWLYRAFGDDAFIISEDRQCRFAAWEYAERRCVEICRPDS